MLSKEENELLVRTGPGTPMGKLYRRYWIPALLPEELPVPDCPPVRIKLLGEQLIAFRDSEGNVGLLEEYCAHRKVSLYYGQNKECGLRCPYHGWKYDVNGQCVDLPSEPKGSNLKNSIKLRSYPCKEHGGVIWAYMGPPDEMPGLPELEWAMVPENQTYANKRIQRNNYMQAMEGGIDSSHVSFLHSDFSLWKPSLKISFFQKVLDDAAPSFFVEPTDYGLLIGARRETQEDQYYWRITQWLFPWYTMIPANNNESIGGHAFVPIDDENCFTWTFRYHPTRPLTKEELYSLQKGKMEVMALIPNTYLPVQNLENDYLIDRDLQRTVSLSGIKGAAAQDQAMQESMGPIVDRSTERLGTSDTAVITVRRLLMRAAREEAAGSGSHPPGLDPCTQRVRSASAVLSKDESWIEATQEARRATATLNASQS